MSNIQREVIRSAGGEVIGYAPPPGSEAVDQTARTAAAAAQADADTAQGNVDSLSVTVSENFQQFIRFDSADPEDTANADAARNFLRIDNAYGDLEDVVITVGTIVLTIKASPVGEDQVQYIAADPEAQLDAIRSAFRDHSTFDSQSPEWNVNTPQFDEPEHPGEWALRFIASDEGVGGNAIPAVSVDLDSELTFTDGGGFLVGGVDAVAGDIAPLKAVWFNTSSGEVFQNQNAGVGDWMSVAQFTV